MYWTVQLYSYIRLSLKFRSCWAAGLQHRAQPASVLFIFHVPSAAFWALALSGIWSSDNRIRSLIMLESGTEFWSNFRCQSLYFGGVQSPEETWHSTVHTISHLHPLSSYVVNLAKQPSLTLSNCNQLESIRILLSTPQRVKLFLTETLGQSASHIAATTYSRS